MKHLLITLILLGGLITAKAQCPLTCKGDSLAYTATKDTLVLSSGYTVVSWTTISGPGVANSAGTSVTGLTPGSTTVLDLLATNGSSTVFTTKVVTVAAPPVVSPTVSTITVSSVALSGSNIVLTLLVGLSNGTSYTETLSL